MLKKLTLTIVLFLSILCLGGCNMEEEKNEVKVEEYSGIRIIKDIDSEDVYELSIVSFNFSDKPLELQHFCKMCEILVFHCPINRFSIFQGSINNDNLVVTIYPHNNNKYLLSEILKR